MFVFTFRIFYEIGGDYQERYVVADSEESAWDKINAHFEKQHREGLMKPAYICDPTVELEGVIC